MKRNEVKQLIFGLPKSIYHNIRLFGFKIGIKLPILFGYKTKVNISKSSKIHLPEHFKIGTIKIGINTGPFNRGYNSYSLVHFKSGTDIYFDGKCNVNAGCILNVNSGTCTFGNNFAANAGFLLSCEKQIVFGENVLFGWDCAVIDGDGHDVLDIHTNKKLNDSSEVIIGNHVWIAARTTILKGAKIYDDSVVGYGSLVCGDSFETNQIIAGIPAKVTKRGITWRR